MASIKPSAFGENTMLGSLVRTFALFLLLIGTQVAASDSAPFGDLVDIAGKPVTSEANVGVGKWQVVMIWATDCHVCSEMKPLLSAFHDNRKDIDAQVYGIALDGAKNLNAVQQYMIEHKVTFPTYIGELGLIAANFEINAEVPLRGTPTYMLFNPTGELVAIDYGMLDIKALEGFISRNS